jgi:hypothetical protein
MGLILQSEWLPWLPLLLLLLLLLLLMGVSEIKIESKLEDSMRFLFIFRV